MICRAKTKMNAASRPLKLPQANDVGRHGGKHQDKDSYRDDDRQELAKYCERLADCDPAAAVTST